ncbi:hypothetical protein CVT24_008967 [Panaeolus cyanescens]|uniref:Chromo domain-containing protein n=1 Tax=Panaeolus cyanescens TaxID=181874 RepID=A0A409YAT7_9AGAR|nr:hypothetical protein CVT24_008967 [Panaeolus cyanescens]
MSEVLTKARIVRIPEKTISRNRTTKHKLEWEYFVKWVGYDSDEDSWQPQENLVEAPIILASFWENAKSNLPEGFKIRVGAVVEPTRAWIKEQRELSRRAQVKKPRKKKMKKDKPEAAVESTLPEEQIHPQTDDIQAIVDPNAETEPKPKLVAVAEEEESITPPVQPTFVIREIQLNLKGRTINANLASTKQPRDVDLPASEMLPKELVIADGFDVAQTWILDASYHMSEANEFLFLQPGSKDQLPEFEILFRYLVKHQQASILPIPDVLDSDAILGHHFIIPFHDSFDRIIRHIVKTPTEILKWPAPKSSPCFLLIPLFFLVGRQPPVHSDFRGPFRGTTASYLRSTVIGASIRRWKSKIKLDRWFALGLNILRIPTDILQWISRDPPNRQFLIWNAFGPTSAANGTYTPSTESVFETHLLSAVLNGLGMKAASREDQTRIVFIHAEAFSCAGILARLTGLKNINFPSMITIYSYGSRNGVLSGVEEVYPCGLRGIVTFTPRALIEDCYAANRLITDLGKHPLWSCYVLPSVLGSMINMCEHGDEEMGNGKTSALNRMFKRISAGDISLVNAPPFGEISSWLCRYRAVTPPSPARAQNLALSSLPLSPDTDILDEISKDILHMQQQPTMMSQYRRYVVIMGESEAKEVGEKRRKKDGLALRRSGFLFLNFNLETISFPELESFEMPEMESARTSSIEKPLSPKHLLLRRKVTPEVDGVVWADLNYVRPVFLALHISGGLVGMPILVATFLLAKNVAKRQPVFVGFCISWIVYSSIYVLLGHTGKPINPAMCYIQTAFVLAAPPMTALSTALVVFKIWWTYRTSQNTEYRNRPRWLKILSRVLLLGAPYFIFAAYTAVSIVLQTIYPGTFDARNGIYCTAYGVKERQWLIPIFCIVCVISMMLFQTLFVIQYLQNRKRLVRSFPLLDKSTSRSLVIRIGLFNLYLFVSFGTGIQFIIGAQSAWPFMIQAGLPLVCFLIFGTQKDVLVAWKILRDPSTTVRASGTGKSISITSTRRPPPEFSMDAYPRKSINIKVHQTSDFHVDKYDDTHIVHPYATSAKAYAYDPEENIGIPVELPNHYDYQQMRR